MFITKKHLSRRTMLKGAGAAIGLPLLDAMIPAGTALAETAAAVKPRVGFIYVPHGSIMKDWTPAQEGAGSGGSAGLVFGVASPFLPVALATGATGALLGALGALPAAGSVAVVI